MFGLVETKQIGGFNFTFVTPSAWLVRSIGGCSFHHQCRVLLEDHEEGIAMSVVPILIIHDTSKVRSFKFGVPETVQRG